MKKWLPLLFLCIVLCASGSEPLKLGAMTKYPNWSFEEVREPVHGAVLASHEFGGTTGRVVLVVTDTGDAVQVTNGLYMAAFYGEVDLLEVLAQAPDSDPGEKSDATYVWVENKAPRNKKEATPTRTSTSTSTDKFVYNLKGGVSNKGLGKTATATATATSVSSSTAFKLNPALAHYQSLRLDTESLLSLKGSLGKKGAREPGLSSVELRAYLEKLKETGILTIVLAYAEKKDVFFYKPSPKFSYLKGKKREKLVPSASPELLKASLTDGKDLIATLLEGAEASNLGVYLGLGVPGDPFLQQDLARKAEGLPLLWPESKELGLELRLKQGIDAAKAQAADLHAQYGKYSAFRGWYLGPPVRCLDQGMKFLAPVAASLRAMGSGKKIVAAASVQEHGCDPKAASREVILKENEKSFDVISYQDGLEATAIADKKNGQATVLEHYGRNDCEKSSCREKLLKLLPTLYSRIAASHQKTSVSFWIESQGTRREGPCADEGEECPEQAAAHPWSFARRQLEQALAQVEPARVLWNGGLSLLNFGGSAEPLRYDTRTQAAELTKAYRNYLNMPAPEVHLSEPERAPVPMETGECALSPAISRQDGRREMLEEEYFQATSSKTTMGLARVQAICGARAEKILEEECQRGEVKRVMVSIQVVKLLADGSRELLKPGSVQRDCGK